MNLTRGAVEGRRALDKALSTALFTNSTLNNRSIDISFCFLFGSGRLLPASCGMKEQGRMTDGRVGISSEIKPYGTI
jgi:hypothetical protein